MLFGDVIDERIVPVRVRAYEGRNAIFSSREYPVNKRRKGSLRAMITQSGWSSIAMACKQNFTGRVSLPPEQLGSSIFLPMLLVQCYTSVFSVMKSCHGTFFLDNDKKLNKALQYNAAHA